MKRRSIIGIALIVLGAAALGAALIWVRSSASAGVEAAPVDGAERAAGHGDLPRLP